MSANKTQNFGLHVWESGDDFLRAEFNENFAAIDAQAARVVAGAYEGDGVDGREIVLGFSPWAVILCDESGRMGFMSAHLNVNGGLFLRDFPLLNSGGQAIARVTENGFSVNTSSYCPLNDDGTRYHYMALR